MMSSRLGFVAEVMATESPSQDSPVVIHRTWAVICSVFCCPGTNSTVPAIGPPSCSINRSGAAGRPPAGPSPACRRTPSATSTIPGGSVFTSPISAARSQPGTARSAASAASARLGRDEGDELALVGHVHRVDPEDLRGARPRPAAPGTSPSRTTIATPEARASSLSTEATPPRVASRMQRSCGPAASSSASTAGHSEHVSDSTARVELELAAREHDRRAVVADRARDEDAVARAQARRRQRRARVDRARRRSCRGTSGRRGRARRPSCRRRRPATPAAAAAAAIASTSARSTSAASPSSSTIDEAERQRPRARHGEVVDRAVDGQLADRAAGEADRLDDEAVGRERDLRRRRSRRVPASASAASAGEPKAGTKRPSISVCVALPPAPWAIVMCASLNRGRLARAVSMMPEDALLAVGHVGPRPLTPTSRSRAKRP